MEQFWLDNIHFMIEGLSDIEQQKRVWLGFAENIVSTYSEDLCMLFDDYDFNEFIENWEKENLDKNILKELILFRDKLDLYNHKVLNNNWHNEEILKDPKWLDVVSQAKKVIEIWECKKE